MEPIDFIQILFFFVLLIVLIPFLGSYMAKVFQGERTFATQVLVPLENFSYKICKINPDEEMNWVRFAKSLLLFNSFGFVAVFLLQLFQYYLPFNPLKLSAPNLPLIFNTAVSFVTNTNWQAYSAENTLSYFTQMMGITVQNFLSAATGLAVLLALIRGIYQKNSSFIGNFWVDIVRATVYLFLPLSIFLAIILVANGVVQTFSPPIEITTLEGVKQLIHVGPAASQVAIKQLGTNGGGFFGANSAHPFENPNAFTDFLEMFAIVLIPAAVVYMYGVMIRARHEAILILGVMFVLIGMGVTIAFLTEDFTPEGQETRFGVVNDRLWTVLTTATANGSVNSSLDSAPPLVGGVALFNIMLGELMFGGMGVGMCRMLMYAFLTVFLSGLMVGRSPEYQGKKVEKKEIQWVMLAILGPSALILIGAGISSVLPIGLEGILNPGPHGLSEILYAFSSASANNGSSFSGLNVNTPYYNLVLGVVMLLGRLFILIPSLALAGLFAPKKIAPPSIGTFSTDTYLFAGLLLGVIIIVGALVFFPPLALGPIVENILMNQGKVF